MTIKQNLTKYSKILKDKKNTSPYLDAEVLLSYVLKKPKEYLYTYPEKKLTIKQLAYFITLIKRRAKGEPIAYLINNKEFFSLNFYVDKKVLIPRPETEMLVEEVIRAVSNKQSVISNQSLTIYDIGTGSGCISITLAKITKAKITAIDVSKDALSVAKKNAKTHKVNSKIKFLQSNLLDKIKNKPDIIVANLPYLDKDNKNLLPSSNIKSLKYEPKSALYAGKDGLDLYKELFNQIKDREFQDLKIFIEVDPKQKIKLSLYIKNLFPQSVIKAKKDLQGLDRVMLIAL